MPKVQRIKGALRRVMHKKPAASGSENRKTGTRGKLRSKIDALGQHLGAVVFTVIEGSLPVGGGKQLEKT